MKTGCIRPLSSAIPLSWAEDEPVYQAWIISLPFWNLSNLSSASIPFLVVLWTDQGPLELTSISPSSIKSKYDINLRECGLDLVTIFVPFAPLIHVFKTIDVICSLDFDFDLISFSSYMMLTPNIMYNLKNI